MRKLLPRRVRTMMRTTSCWRILLPSQKPKPRQLYATIQSKTTTTTTVMMRPLTRSRPVSLLQPLTTKMSKNHPNSLKKTRRLNLRLENNPKNQATWLELIDLQDSLLANAATTNTGMAAASSTSITATRQAKLHKAITEKKLAIYEKALKHFPTCLELLIPYLTLCEIEFGDSNPTRLLTLWDRVLKRTKGESVQLWDRYLTYRQTSYLSFGVNGFVDAVQECMDVLKGLEDSESNQSGLLHIFTRLCNLLHESGYTERAVALYQGQIEFSCFTPPAFEEMDWRQRVDLFEDFWESECPRVGEPGATGWKANVMGAEGVAGYKPFKAGDDEDLIVNDGDDEYKIWFRKEMEYSFMNWAPQRSTSVKEEDPDSMQDGGDEDEEDDVDPFATIIFDDIRPFLFNLSSPNLKSQLISNFLNLLSCQFNTTCTSTPLLVVAESLMRVELMNNALVSQFFPKPVGKEVANTTSPAFPSFPLNNFPITVSTLYSNSIAASSNNNPSLLTPAAVASIQDSGNQKLEFIKHVIRQSCKAVDDWDDIGIPLILSMEAASAAGESSKGGGVKAALKLGKSMLKEERMNLSLWAFYAGLEAGRGKLDEARKIFQTALSAYRTFPPENQHDAVLLYVAYTELEMDCQEYCRALWILVSFADSSVDLGKIETERPSATRILKARKFLNEMADAAIQKCNSDYQVTLQQPSSQAIRITSSLITSTCLFEYLHSNNNIEEAFQSISLSLSKLGLLPALRELVLETRLKLYVTHSKRPGVFVRPGDIRTAMELAVSEFPHNTSFLLRFVEYESKTKIENKVRRLFDVELKKNPSSTLWLFAIFTELHHYSGQTYNPHSVRSLFSRAHECPTGKHCPSVWYLSIIFEILQGNVTKAKQLLFRAIRECPWSKKLYMLAMGELRGVFDGSEVAEIIGVMEEKEIRLRCAI
ncbi:NRDE-2, necessary for RNA interference-domain-containing protein [Obelidium mucronatum]|nr:NRDE-2, necessary for RNA interference-domain-containing protein [Obelidium mucronatum]